MRALRFASHETSNQGIGRKLLLHVKHQFRESIACNQGATAHVALRSLVNKSWTDLHEDMLQRRATDLSLRKPGKWSVQTLQQIL